MDKKKENIGRPRSGVYYKCDNCGEECYTCQSDYDRREHHFCGKKCSGMAKRGENNYNYKEKNKIICGICNTEFEVIDSILKSGHGKYCSKECQFKAQETAVVFECQVCGEDFKKYQSAIERTGNHFCSKECYGVSLRGEFYDPSDNRKRSEGRAWRKRVLKRDDYTCQRCDEKEDELHAHHLNGYANNIDLRLDISNGVTLCKECHEEFHREFGKLEFTPENYYNWIKNKIAC